MKSKCLIIFSFLASVFSLECSAQVLFELIPSASSGIDFSNDIVDSKEKSILTYSNYYGGAGIAIADFDNDGLQDLFFAGNLVHDRLYKNLGGLKFEEITAASGILIDSSWSSSVLTGDINNDGLIDIYVTCELYDDNPKLRSNKLYINQGDFKFSEMASQFGLDNTERTRGATFIDYNRDGFLDLYLLNQPPNPGNYSKFSGQSLLREEWSPRLMKSINGKSFIDVSAQAGLLIPSYPNAAVAADLNNDGWQDLYVANDYDAPDFCFINNQDGTFKNILDDGFGHISYYAMGVDIADINNDGLLDIMTLDMVAEDNYRQKANMGGMYPSAFWKLVKNGGHYQYMYNSMQLNYGKEKFGNIAHLANVSSTDWSWSNLIADFDNDGFKDAYVTNGLLRDIRNSDISKEFPAYIKSIAGDYLRDHPGESLVPILEIMDLDKALDMHPSVPLSNYALKNNGDLTFQKVTEEWGLDIPSFSNGSAYGDLDNDGDLDLVVNNINAAAFLYRNQSAQNYLRIALVDESNRPILGAKAKIETESGAQFGEITSSRGMYSTSENILHFGLFDEKVIKEISITWPDGLVQLMTNVKANQLLTVTKIQSLLAQKTTADEAYVVTKTSKIGIDFKHSENDFDDFDQQILLPHELSHEGPAVAVGDVNSDGLDDLFLGGATGQLPVLYVQNETESFERKQTFQAADALFEDVDALLFDLENDGDLDLYVVSGGNSKPISNKVFLDRIYLNDGAGNFVRKQDGFPRILESGSCVRAFDYDNDGDTDLFVGGRHMPWNYPSPSVSRLLRNDGGVLTDVTKELAPDLILNGMVTDAVWSDYDNDGKTDLIAVGEWMPITFYKNTGQGLDLDLKMSSKKAGVEVKTNGWWSHISALDIDNDGDTDYLCGNLGENYKYKATQDQPFEVHYDDFDSNGKKDIVLSYYNFGDRYPLRGRSCSAQQIPGIAQKFASFDLFAQSDLEAVYGGQALSKALHLEAFMFESVMLLNNGNNSGFEIKSLPNEAQISAINTTLIQDYDGGKRIFIAGNNYQAEIETPRNDASPGMILDYEGGEFYVLPPNESGIRLTHDVRHLREITVGEKRYILVVSNDDIVRMIKAKA